MTEFNPYSRRFHADPYPAYAELSERDPVARNERFGFWMLSRYDDVLGALKDWRTFSSASGITVQSFTGLKPMIILMDPPGQVRIRGILLKAFTPRRIAALERRMREIAGDLIASFADTGRCEFAGAFASVTSKFVIPTAQLATLATSCPQAMNRAVKPFA